MKERPIIFNSEMVNAILEGRKTQTRRPIKKIADHYEAEVMPNKCQDGSFVFIVEPDGNFNLHCPFGRVGDRLWVRETFKCYNDWHYIYKAEGEDTIYSNMAWTSSIHMRHEESRITLEITDVRVERVQDIEENVGDIISEGYPCAGKEAINNLLFPVDWFSKLWNSIYGQDAWYRDDWVWVVEFKVIK